MLYTQTLSIVPKTTMLTKTQILEVSNSKDISPFYSSKNLLFMVFGFTDSFLRTIP